MKNSILVVSAAFLFMMNGAVAQSVSNPAEYMGLFSTHHDAISKDMWDYTSVVARSKGARKVENKRQDLLSTINSSRMEIKRMKGYEGDEGLRDTLVSYLNLMTIMLKEDYGKILDLEEIAEQSYDNMEAYLLAKEMASKKLDMGSAMMVNEQKRFATDHEITLLDQEENKVSKKLERAGKAFANYNKVYLIFFKSYKQEAYLLDALNKGDVAAIEQNKNALSQTSAEGLEKLSKVESLNNDATLKNSCKSMLNFFKDEADVQMAVIVDFYLKKEKFEKIQAAFESKKKSQRTQEDVDQVNKAGNEFNAAVNKYNATNDALNKNRAEQLKNWNKSVEKFLDKHAA